MASIPTRVDQDLFEAAKAAGELHSRSAAQQIAHWARLGQQIEASPTVSVDSVARVLAGEADYDALGTGAQAAVRIEWDRRISETLADLDFTAELNQRARPWPEADQSGRLLMRQPSPPEP